jgi:hypothetical protein
MKKRHLSDPAYASAIEEAAGPVLQGDGGQRTVFASLGFPELRKTPVHAQNAVILSIPECRFSAVPGKFLHQEFIFGTP